MRNLTNRAPAPAPAPAPVTAPMARPCRVPIGVWFLSWVLLAPESVVAQGRTLDEGVLRVTIGGTEVAREEFSIVQGRSFDGGTGYRLLATAFYPPRRTRVTIPSSVELGPDSLPRLAQFGPITGRDLVTLAQFGPRRLTLQTRRSTGRTFREYPGVARNWVADDSLLSLYALPPGTAPGTVRLVSPRHGSRVDFILSDRGFEETVVGTRTRELRHLVLSDAADVRHLWYDAGGRLMKVEIPARRLVAVREVGSANPNR